MTDRYGNTSMATVLRDWNALRDAIRAHDTEATEAAFEKVERWVGLWTTGQAFTADDLRRAWEMGSRRILLEIRDHDDWRAACNLTPPDDLPARVKEGGDE